MNKAGLVLILSILASGLGALSLGMRGERYARDALEYYQRGKYREAVERFLAADRAAGGTVPEYHYWLGRVHIALADTAAAGGWWRKYSASGDTRYSKTVNDYFHILDRQSQIFTQATLLPMPQYFNSGRSDYGASLDPEGNYVYFTSLRPAKKAKENIWRAEIFRSGYGKPQLVEELSTEKNEAFGSFSTSLNGALIAGNYEKNKLDGDLYLVDRQQGWARPRNLAELNSPQLDIQPMLAQDRFLFFTSARVGTVGGTDIYVSELVDGVWTPPQNLGPSINTAGNEQTPFLADDGNTLYFASNGHSGFGGYDIFKAYKIGSGWQSWSIPENLGLPFNSPRNDRYFYLISGTNEGFISSDRKVDGFENVYRFTYTFPPQPSYIVQDEAGNRVPQYLAMEYPAQPETPPVETQIETPAPMEPPQDEAEPVWPAETEPMWLARLEPIELARPKPIEVQSPSQQLILLPTPEPVFRPELTAIEEPEPIWLDSLQPPQLERAEPLAEVSVPQELLLIPDYSPVVIAETDPQWLSGPEQLEIEQPQLEVPKLPEQELIKLPESEPIFQPELVNIPEPEPRWLDGQPQLQIDTRPSFSVEMPAQTLARISPPPESQPIEPPSLPPVEIVPVSSRPAEPFSEPGEPASTDDPDAGQPPYEAPPGTMFTLQGTVRDQDGNAVMSTLELTATIEGIRTRNIVLTNSLGDFDANLPWAPSYSVVINESGYLLYSATIRLVPESEVIDLNVTLRKLEKKKALAFGSVFFAQDSAELSQAEKANLDDVVLTLLNNPEVRVRVSGHAYEDGTSKYNLELSDRRARAVADYLISKGIDKKRLSWASYGNNQPLYGAVDPSELPMNRRVEIEVVK